MVEPRLLPRTGPSRRRDAMPNKRRNGHASTKTSVEDEIAHLRGLDLRGLRARWLSVFQRPAPAHLTGTCCLRSSPIGFRLTASATSIKQPDKCWIERLRRKPDRQCPPAWPA